MKTILVDAVHCFIEEKEEGKFGIFVEMYDLLETYINNKIILTNASGDKIEFYGLNNMPYQVFTLKHNPEKTDPKYYEILLERYGLSKDDVVCFEHSIDAIKSAQSIGINTYYYNEEERDLGKLKEFLDNNLK